MIFYFNLARNKILHCMSLLLPNIFIHVAVNTCRYPISHPRFHNPWRAHQYISKMCKFIPHVHLNSMKDNTDSLTHILKNV